MYAFLTKQLSLFGDHHLGEPRFRIERRLIGMSTVNLVRVAVVASLATTGGAIYYRLSDGGDPDVARKKVEENVTKLENKVYKFGEAGTAFLQKLKTMTAGVQHIESEGSHSTEPAKVQSNESSDSENETTTISPPLRQINEDDSHPFCHTCSGPRIWFFAEKLRLKRRFTPYPDPPRE